MINSFPPSVSSFLSFSFMVFENLLYNYNSQLGYWSYFFWTLLCFIPSDSYSVTTSEEGEKLEHLLQCFLMPLLFLLPSISCIKWSSTGWMEEKWKVGFTFFFWLSGHYIRSSLLSSQCIHLIFALEATMCLHRK